MLLSPFIAIIAIIQWIVRARQKRIGGYSNEYERGYQAGLVAGSRGYAASQETAQQSLPSAAPVATTDGSPQLTASGFVDVTSSLVTEPSAGPFAEGPTTSHDYSSSVVTAAPLTQEEKTRRTLNILLSLGSLLFVAAGIAFITSNFPSGVKLFGICMIVTFFYLGGLALHWFSETLRPAAIAFIGTGLALIPFLAVAFSAYGGMSGEYAWLTVSLIGIGAYYFAAVYLQSQVVSYLTVAFALSLTDSIVATAALPLVWYFAVMIIISLAASVVALMRPSWIPKLFQGPVQYTGTLVTPLALGASLIAFRGLELWHYELLFSLATLHYLVVALQRKSYGLEQLVRLLAHVTLLLIAYDITETSAGFGVLFTILLVAQQMYSVIRTRYAPRGVAVVAEPVWLWVCFAAYLVTPLFWVAVDAAVANTLVLYIILVISLYCAFMLRVSDYGYPGLLALLVLPTYVGSVLTHPSLPAWQITALYTLGAAAALALYFWRARHHSLAVQLLNRIAICAFGLVATVWVLLVPQGGEGIILSGVLTILYIAASYVKFHPYTVVLSSIPILMLSQRIADIYSFGPGETGFIIFGVAAGLAYALGGILGLFGSRARHNVLFAVGQACVVAFALSSLFPLTALSANSAHIVAVCVLLVWLAGSWVAKRLSKSTTSRLYQLFTASYLTYFIVALGISYTLPDSWRVGLLALGVVILWELSYRDKVPTLVYSANALVVWWLYELMRLIGMQEMWIPLSLATISSCLFYTGQLVLSHYGDTTRQTALLYSTWALIGFGVSSSLILSDTTVAGAGLLLFGAATVAIEGYSKRATVYYEVALYLAAGAASILLRKLAPDVDAVVYAHLWASVLAAAGYIRRQGIYRYVLALALLTLVVGLQALEVGGYYSLLFLVEHVVLATLGALYNKPWALRWGVIASILAVFYYLKDIPFLAFTALGAGLIAFVIWRLKRAHTPRPTKIN